MSSSVFLGSCLVEFGVASAPNAASITLPDLFQPGVGMTRDEFIADRDARYAALTEVFMREDMLGVVLRTHLFVEHELREFISRRVPNEVLKTLKPRYNQMVRLAIKLGLAKDFEGPLKWLGEKRNSYAHNLDYELSSQMLDEFYDELTTMMQVVVQQLYVELKTDMPQFSLPAFTNGLGLRQRFALYAASLWSILKMENAPAE